MAKEISEIPISVVESRDLTSALEKYRVNVSGWIKSPENLLKELVTGESALLVVRDSAGVESLIRVVQTVVARVSYNNRFRLTEIDPPGARADLVGEGYSVMGKIPFGKDPWEQLKAEFLEECQIKLEDSQRKPLDTVGRNFVSPSYGNFPSRNTLFPFVVSLERSQYRPEGHSHNNSAGKRIDLVWVPLSK